MTIKWLPHTCMLRTIRTIVTTVEIQSQTRFHFPSLWINADVASNKRVVEPVHLYTALIIGCFEYLQRKRIARRWDIVDNLTLLLRPAYISKTEFESRSPKYCNTNFKSAIHKINSYFYRQTILFFSIHKLFGWIGEGGGGAIQFRNYTRMILETTYIAKRFKYNV